MRRLLFTLAVCVPLLTACHRQAEVVVYSALDREFSEPVLKDFSRETGIRVLPKYDVESTKTVGLTQAIISEANRPRCDLFWNNEILNTLRLRKLGLLDVYQSPAASDYPAMYKSSDGTWHGFAGRARILLVNTKLVSRQDRPNSIYDLADPRFKGKIGIAKPLFGTTATHAACLFESLGDERAKEFFESLKANDIQVLGGNKQIAEAVSAGQLHFGLTDTDDAVVEIERGQPVEIVYPDREQDELGTLFIPNTLAVIRGCPNPENARALVEYLLSRKVETKLAGGASAQIPLNPNVDIRPRVETPATVKAMPVDFDSAAENWDAAASYIEGKFLKP
jgi:iron(III) transport system substrate-binding protein